jgi:tetratricopeptide (TPR) repeat protein
MSTTARQLNLASGKLDAGVRWREPSRVMKRSGLAGSILCALALTLTSVAPVPPVRVWQSTMQIPTYAEGAANPNPPFDLFSFGRFNYPYPIRDALTDRRESIAWRTLNLENEYLRLTVLPDLGGHIYSCLDKRTGREMFYANTAIKKALIGYRGAWAAFGVEFNFPVSHNWMSMSPVDFATMEHPDGSGSIWVGNVDQVYGGQWRVELRLAPGRSVLEQKIDLYNTSRARHRYYWWNNGAVQVWDDSRLVYPTELMATHGFTRIQRWPVDEKGQDLSVIRNQADGPVSLFTYGTREGFVGVYHPQTRSGTVHVASPSELPTHKVWSWGHDRDAADWRTALSDDDSAYVELQAGLFRNQETYAFLEPQETVSFSEYWLPVRDLGGITRANIDAVMHMERTTPTHVRIALDVTRDVADAHVAIAGGTSGFDGRVSLSPRETWRWEGDVATTGTPLRLEVTDAVGQPVISHTENQFDRTPAAAVQVAPQPSPRIPHGALDVDDILQRGETDELEGRRQMAMSRYQAAITRYPDSVSLLKAAGRLAVSLGWADAGTPASLESIRWLERALASNTTDFEVQYYIGVALASAGRTAEARRLLESSQRFRTTAVPSSLELARLLARQDSADLAVRQLKQAESDSPRATVPPVVEAALLRLTGHLEEAREQARKVRVLDPTSSFARYELTRLNQPDDDLWRHLAVDANRVLDLVDQYLAIGAFDDALRLLQRQYPPVAAPLREPGAVGPNESPLVAYYRGYVLEKTGGNAAADFKAARSLSTRYVFPSRRSSYAVLNAALKADPSDGTARFLLGSLYLSSDLVEPAVESWQRVRQGRSDIPVLHRNLGLALLQQGEYREARSVLEEGVGVDKENVDVYLTLDGVLSALGASARERAAALGRFPAAGNATPAALAFKSAFALAEAGDGATAERLFHDRFFPREEGGTNVRTVYAQVRLITARVAADSGKCDAARQILDSFPDEQTGLSFTNGGLTDVVQAPTLSLQAADIESKCGRTAAAQARWERLARPLAADGAPLTLAIADTAARRLGRPRTAAERARLERALESATATLESAGTSGPGLLEYASSMLLAALGKSGESHESLRRVFTYPDRGLSHVLARNALKSQGK